MTPSRMDYTQEPHGCAPVDAEPILTLAVQDSGGGPYLVLEAHEWAFDSLEDILVCCNVIIQGWHSMVRAREAGPGTAECESAPAEETHP